MSLVKSRRVRGGLMREDGRKKGRDEGRSIIHNLPTKRG